MNLLIGRTDTYLHSQWRDTRTPWGAPKSPPPFITISREAGSGGSSLARLLTRRLNGESPADIVWRVYEGNLTTKMLEANQLAARVARFLPEDRVSELASSIGELVGLHPNLWELVQKTNETMRTLAQQGHVVLVGRGANFATAGLPNGLHVRLVASEEHRARYLAQRYNIPEAEALAHNRRGDAARRRYVKTNFNADVDDPRGYDLCLNTEKMPLDAAASLIATQVHTFAKQP
jgi:cytidylate kinase